MSKKHCLDNPTKPNAPYRALMAKRRKADSEAVKAKLTPALLKSLDLYKSIGRELAAVSAAHFKKELGEALLAALDGELDIQNVDCAYCVQISKQKELRVQAEAAGMVSSSL
jgi:hypothetical protein